MKAKQKLRFNPLGAAIALYFVTALIAISIYFGSKIIHFLTLKF